MFNSNNMKAVESLTLEEVRGLYNGEGGNFYLGLKVVNYDGADIVIGDFSEYDMQAYETVYCRIQEWEEHDFMIELHTMLGKRPSDDDAKAFIASDDRENFLDDYIKKPFIHAYMDDYSSQDILGLTTVESEHDLKNMVVCYCH